AGLAVARQDARPPRAARVLVAGARHQLAAHFLGARGLAVLLLALGNSGLERALRAGDRALARLVLALGVAGLLAFALLVLVLARGFGVAEVEVLDQLARGSAVGVLIRDHAVEVADVAADLALEEGSPEIHHPLGCGRWRGTGELL